MITQGKVNSVINKVSTTKEKISSNMNSLQNKAFQSGSWWEGSDHSSGASSLYNGVKEVGGNIADGIGDFIGGGIDLVGSWF